MSTTITPSYSLGLTVRNFLASSLTSTNVKSALPRVLEFVRGLHSGDSKASKATADSLGLIQDLHEAVSANPVATKIQAEARCMDSKKPLLKNSSLVDAADVEGILEKLKTAKQPICCEINRGDKETDVLDADRRILFSVERVSGTEYKADGTIPFSPDSTLYKLINENLPRNHKLSKLSFLTSGKR
jgi:hypothetical protein